MKKRKNMRFIIHQNIGRNLMKKKKKLKLIIILTFGIYILLDTFTVEVAFLSRALAEPFLDSYRTASYRTHQFWSKYAKVRYGAVRVNVKNAWLGKGAQQ